MFCTGCGKEILPINSALSAALPFLKLLSRHLLLPRSPHLLLHVLDPAPFEIRLVVNVWRSWWK